MTATIERTGSSAGLGPNTPQNDLRTFIATVEARGELATVRGAHWDKELGAVTEVLYRQKVEKSPMLMFDDIPGYAPGYRCTYGMFGSPYRLGLVLGMESDARRRSQSAARLFPQEHQEGVQADPAHDRQRRSGVREHRARRRHRRRRCSRCRSITNSTAAATSAPPAASSRAIPIPAASTSARIA